MFDAKRMSRMTESEIRAYVRRQVLKDMAKRKARGKRDRLASSMLHKNRVRVGEDGETWKEYGFVFPEDIDLGSDEELRDWFEENMAVRIFSDYDCTGRAFTTNITWHRNPSGLISYVHRMAIDV